MRLIIFQIANYLFKKIKKQPKSVKDTFIY